MISQLLGETYIRPEQFNCFNESVLKASLKANQGISDVIEAFRFSLDSKRVFTSFGNSVFATKEECTAFIEKHLEMFEDALLYKIFVRTPEKKVIQLNEKGFNLLSFEEKINYLNLNHYFSDRNLLTLFELDRRLWKVGKPMRSRGA